MPRPSKGARLWPDKRASIWYVRDGTRKRSTQCGLDDREGAEKFLAQYVAAKYEPPTDHRAKRLLIADVLTYYLREIAVDHRSRTAAYAVERLIEWWGDKTLADVRRSTCRAYVEYRSTQSRPQAKTAAAKARKIAPETARRELGVLRAAIGAYHAETPLDAVPEVTLPPAAPARSRWLTRKEVADFLRVARKFEDKDAGRALIRFTLIAVYTATRSGAIRSLQWDRNREGGWVSIENRTIHRAAEGESATRKRKGALRIPDALFGFLRRWEEEDSRKGLTHVVHYRSQPVAAQRKSWEAARKAAGLGADVTPHILKHSAITWMMQAGSPPWEVAAYANTSLETIEKVYGHHHPDHLSGVRSRKR